MNSRATPFGPGPFPLRRPLPLTEDGDSIDVRALFQLVLRRKWLIVGVTLLCAIVSGILVSLVTPSYTAGSKVILDARHSQVITEEEVVSDLDLSDEVVNGEVSVLRSNVLLEQVIRTVGFERLESLDPANKPPSLISRVKGWLSSDDGTVHTPEQLEQFKLERLIWQVRTRQTVRREGKSFVIAIWITTDNAALSALLANAIANEYIDRQLAGRQETAQRATSSIEDRVAELRADVENNEAAVEQYRAEILILEGGSLGAAAAQLVELNSQLISARSDRIAADAGYTQVEKVIGEQGFGALANLVSSPLIDKLNEELLDAERKDAVWSDRYSTDHPERIRIQAEISGIKKDLEREGRKILEVRKSELEVARFREQAMQESLGEVEERLLAISRANIGLRQLEREAEAARQSYEQLLSRLNETRTQEQLQEADAVLIERATPPGAPSSPKKKLTVVMGAMVGLGLGAGLAFFLEMTGVAFRNGQELETATGLPVLASVPKGDWKTPIGALNEVRSDPYGIYGERIRHLRTALLMKDGQDVSRSIMLASSVPGEGKTTTTMALAHMATLADKSVIVVDCDLRRSAWHTAFRWDLQHDFVDFIEHRCDIDDAIVRDEELGFDVLCATGSHPTVADQLSAKWLKPLFDELKSVYDVVLVDAPAMLAVSDALVVGQAVDARVYVVHWGETPRAAVIKGLAGFREMGLEMDGVIMTMVDTGQSTDAYSREYSYTT